MFTKKELETIKLLAESEHNFMYHLAFKNVDLYQKVYNYFSTDLEELPISMINGDGGCIHDYIEENIESILVEC